MEKMSEKDVEDILLELKHYIGTIRKEGIYSTSGSYFCNSLLSKKDYLQKLETALYLSLQHKKEVN